MNTFIILLFLLNIHNYFQETQGVRWPCSTSLECNVVEDAFCSNYGYCRCPIGFVYTSDITRCIKESLYGEACVDSVQCSHMLTGSRCNAGVCDCLDGYTYVRGRCRILKKLHEHCLNDIECSFAHDRESVICKNEACQCADGFYQRSENVCRRVSYLDDACVVNTDCHGGNLRCASLKCVEITKQFRNAGTQVDNKSNINEDTLNFKNYVALSDKVVMDNKFVQTESKLTVGSSCNTNDEGCPGLPHSACLDGECVCLAGYYNLNGVCKAELGEKADSAESCHGDGKYRDGKCLCEPNTFYMPNMRNCIKPTVGINLACTQQNQCSPFGASYCPDISPKRCQCHAYSEYDANTQLCVRKTGISEYCEKNEDCTVEHTECTPQNLCLCKSDYVAMGNECKPGNNAVCENSDECSFDNSECVKDTPADQESISRCKCKKGFVYFMDVCMKEASFDEDCNHSEQCQPLLGDLAKCEESKCVCDESAHLKDEKCFDKIPLGAPCVRASECFVTENENKVECRNAMCQCQFGYENDVERQRCRPVTGKSASGRPSPLKVITLLLTTSAFLITSAAIREAYFS